MIWTATQFIYLFGLCTPEQTVSFNFRVFIS
uniref:Uncharacterized protein n=1 Tax=Anguilla anguilla TaxID=7936 RepID=A0A0E9SKW9_ANGAN